MIDTIMRNFPLNSIYWARQTQSKEELEFEVLNGQQRTIAICDYIRGDFSVDERFFHTLSADEKEKILEYELMVYICEGKDSEKLEWFRVINIAGEKLTDQELRNAVYVSTWLSDAKFKFSKNNCLAAQKKQ